MEFQIETAQRTQAKLRIGLAAPSGGGKTYSALQLAYGLTGDWNKIGVIDTEQHSSSLYAHMGSYKIINLTAPFTPERYIGALHAFEKADMKVVIIDSVTHVWSGEGGLLEYNTSLGGRFQDWAKTTPRYQHFLQGILQSSLHVITTIRKKESYAMTNENGKTRVEKQGLDDEIRGGFNYELTVAFDVNIHHLAEASKDRTGLFMKSDGSNVGLKIDQSIGKLLKDWANEGATVPVTQPTPVAAPKDFIEEMEEIKQKQIVDSFGDEANDALQESIPESQPEPDKSYCTIHKVQMKERHGKNGIFYSHARQLGSSWDYCSGTGYNSEKNK